MIPELSTAEIERRLDLVAKHLDAAEEETAIDLITATLAERLDQEARRGMLRTLAKVRRSLFWRDHPLHAAVRLDAERYRFGDSMHLEIELTNLGESRLEMRARPDSWFGIRSGEERGMIDLTFELTACDLAGSRVVDRTNLPRAIEEDISIEPGGTARLDLEVPLLARPGAVFGIVAVEAVIRPLEIDALDSNARFGAIACGGARARVERGDLERWMRGGLEALDEALAPGAEERAAEILLAAGGLEDRDLAAAIDRLSLAAEGLGGARRRLALASAAWLLGEENQRDPIGLRSYWLTTGVGLDPATLGRRRLGGAATRHSLLAGGSVELDGPLRAR